MECHMTVEYNDVNWKASLETDEVAYCRGAAEYMANTFSSPRNPAWRAVVDRAVEEAGDRTNSPAYPGIFGWTDEFLAHHDNDMNARYVEESHSLATNKPYPNAFDTQEEYETALAKWREEHAS